MWKVFVRCMFLATLLVGWCKAWTLRSSHYNLHHLGAKATKRDIMMNSVERQSSNSVDNGGLKVAKSLCVALLSTFACFNPFCIAPAHANTAEAAKLFSAAESAIEKAATDYKALDDNYASVSRNLDTLFKSTDKSANQLKDIQQDLSNVLSRYAKLLSTGEEVGLKIRQEIDSLQTSVAQKYLQAEGSANKLDKPAITAKLFIQAQNEASVLEQTEKLNKVFGEVDEELKRVYSNKLQAIYDKLVELNTKELVDVLNADEKSLKEMDEGLAMNNKACKESMQDCSKHYQEGMKVFKQGVSRVDKAQEEYGQVLRSLEAAVKQLDGVKSEVSSLSSRLNSLADSQQQWEKDSKLSLKQSKGAFNQFRNDLQGVDKLISERDQKLSSAYQKNIYPAYTSSNFNGNSKNKKDGSLVDQLKDLEKKMETASQSGIKAEKAFSLAKARGEKEAQIYMKKLPKVAPGVEVTKAAPYTGPSVASPSSSPSAPAAVPTPSAPLSPSTVSTVSVSK